MLILISIFPRVWCYFPNPRNAIQHRLFKRCEVLKFRISNIRVNLMTPFYCIVLTVHGGRENKFRLPFKCLPNLPHEPAN